MVLGFDFGDASDIGLYSAGFELDGFEPMPAKVEPTETAVYSRPVVFAPQTVCYEHAEEFAGDIKLDNATETFAFVSGNFVFGDFVEALVDTGKLNVRRMGVQTLSLNDENIDSVRNICEWEGVERLDIVLSDYWFAHERKAGGLVDYLFDELDIEGLDLHVAFCGTHAKVWTFETRAGNVLTIHGSANLRSSRNVEQLHISPDRGLFEFCDGMLKRMVEVYDVVNQDARKRKSVRGSKLWQAAARKAAGAAGDAEAGAGVPREAGVATGTATGATVPRC